MSTASLIFFPSNPSSIIDNERILNTLILQHFIESSPHSKNNYLAGEDFLSLLIFLGCSPNIILSPAEGDAYCAISLIKPSEQVQYLGHTKTIHPKCPACKKRIADWETSGWKKTGSICVCDKCQTATPYANLNWKHECGFARCGFIVSHIYPHEAVPSDQLLNALQKESGFKWNYCYSNSQIQTG